MSKPSRPPQPHWTIADLIDLEFALSRRQRGREADFFRDEIEEWIDPEEIVRPGRITMSRALWRWLDKERRSVGDRQLPGRAYSAALTLVGGVAVICTFAIGVGTVLGLLNVYDGRTFHVLLLLALTIGVQWVFLLLSLLGLATWGWWREHAFVSAAQRLVAGGTNRLVRRSLGEEAANWWRETARTRRLFGLPAWQVSQLAAVAFSVGSLAALAGCVLLLTVRFGWETTAMEGLGPMVENLVRGLATPWAWLRPGWVPDAAVIAETRIEWNQGKPVIPAAAVSARWYPFLLACLVVWGILPRLLFVMLAAGMRQRALGNYSFQERQHREWWRALTETEVHAEVAGPADGAFALLMGGLEEAGELRRACLQQLRLNLEGRASLGMGSMEDDGAALQQAIDWIRRHPEGRLVLVAESWALVPKEFREVHARLRESLGPDAPMDLLLIGLPVASSGALQPPAEEEIAMWEKFAGELGDPFLYIQPFQAALAR